MIQLRDLQRQHAAMQHEMADALSAAVASAQYIMGPEVLQLEQQLSSYVGVKHCITCANGTDALRLAAMAMGIGKGDAVFVPDFTFFASAEAIALQGATPIFVDVDPKTYNLALPSLQQRYAQVVQQGTLRPKAVVAVDLFGLPANYALLAPWCREQGLLLIEDGAQGFGGSIGQSRVGSFADIATTSFFPAKPLGCYGDGGALFTNNDAYATALRSLRIHGKGTDKYDNQRLGLNSRIDTLQAAVLLVKLRHFDAELQAVRHVAEAYNQLLATHVQQLPTVPQGMATAWAQYTIQVADRQAVQQRLAAAGIASAVYYPRTMSQQTVFAHLHQEPCSTALALTGQVLSLPMHPYLTEAEIAAVAKAITNH